MTLADLNNCVPLRRKQGMDLDPMEFKPCTVNRGWNQACAPVAALTLIPTTFLGWVFFFFDTVLQLRCQIYPNYFTV